VASNRLGVRTPSPSRRACPAGPPPRRTHIGKLKSARSKKLTTDAFELAWARGKRGASRLTIAVADVETERYLLRPRAWLTAALRDAGVEVIRVDLNEALRASVAIAQDRQYR
jgi:hypothetical protein